MGIWVEDTLSLALMGCIYKVYLAVRCGNGFQESDCLLCQLDEHHALKFPYQRSWLQYEYIYNTQQSKYRSSEGV